MFKSEVGPAHQAHHLLHVYRVQAVLNAACTRADISLFVCKNKNCSRTSAVFEYISYQDSKLNNVDFKKIRERFYLICLEKCSNFMSAAVVGNTASTCTGCRLCCTQLVPYQSSQTSLFISENKHRQKTLAVLDFIYP
jgi:hypothetical protein